MTHNTFLLLCKINGLFKHFNLNLTDFTDPINSKSPISHNPWCKVIVMSELGEIEAAEFFIGTARLICTYQHNKNIMNTAYRCSLLTAMAKSRMIGVYPWMFVFRNTHTHAHTHSPFCPPPKMPQLVTSFPVQHTHQHLMSQTSPFQTNHLTALIANANMQIHIN